MMLRGVSFRCTSAPTAQRSIPRPWHSRPMARSEGADARDAAGRIVPLHVGATLYVGVSVPRHRGEDRQMMAHELLRQAALILAAGWSKGADARDDAGRIVF